MNTPFLNAEWRKLIMVNYAIEPALLAPYTPAFTEIDFFEGKTYLSLVGFMFLNTRVMGYQIPWHIHFEEVNLRFYVRHFAKGEWRRGVCFIKEIVPKTAIAWVANTIYRENYVSLPMKHHITLQNEEWQIEYAWKHQKQWNQLQVIAENKPQILQENTQEEFIAEHYWGYAKKNSQTTVEYQVTHPKWEIYPVKTVHIHVGFADLYGKTFAEVMKQKPSSVFLAEGSEIAVLKRNWIKGK
jgi:hypothetical protein